MAFQRTQKEVSLLLSFKMSRQDTRNALREFRLLDNSLDQFTQTERENERAARALAAADRDMIAVLKNVVGSTDSAKREVREYGDVIDDATQSVNRLTNAQQGFEATSRDVALAGDVQSNLGAIRGLSSVAGFGGAGQGIGAAGEVVALVEELPRLKTALAGMPQTISAAVSALGITPQGATLVAALAAVTAASVLAFKALNAQRIEARRAAIERAEAFIQAGQDETARAVAIREFTAQGSEAVINAIEDTKIAIADLQRERERIVARRALLLEAGAETSDDVGEALRLGQRRIELDEQAIPLLQETLVLLQKAGAATNELNAIRAEEIAMEEKIAGIKAATAARGAELEAQNVIAAAAFAAAEEKRGRVIQELTTVMFESTEKIKALKDEIIAIGDAADEAVDKVEAQLIETIAKAQLRESDALAKAAQTASDARADLQATLDERLIRLAEDRATKLLQITRRFNRSSANAIQDRDAVALDQATQQAADELADLDAAQKLELQRIDRFEREKLRLIERQLMQQNAAAQQAATRAIALARQKAATEISLIRQQAAQQIALRRQEIAVQFGLLNAARARRMQLMTANIQATIVETNLITRLWSNMMLAVRGMTAAAAAAVRPAGVGAGTVIGRIQPTRLAGGGDFKAGELLEVGERGRELAMFGSPGRIIPNNQISNFGSPLNMNITGASTRTIEVTSRKQAIEILTEFINTKASLAGL